MQGVQNIPAPDTISTNRDDDFGSHSRIDQNLNNDDIEQANEEIPVPPDQNIGAPVEEPPSGENVEDPSLIV